MKETFIKKVIIFYASKPEVKFEVLRDEYRIIPSNKKAQAARRELARNGIYIKDLI